MQHVLIGAEEAGLPSEYVRHLEEIEVISVHRIGQKCPSNPGQSTVFSDVSEKSGPNPILTRRGGTSDLPVDSCPATKKRNQESATISIANAHSVAPQPVSSWPDSV